MADRKRNILLIPNGIADSDSIQQILSKSGILWQKAASSTEIRVKCRQQDFDLIITGPPDPHTGSPFEQQGYPVNIPILCVGPESIEISSYPGIISCFAATRSREDLLGQIGSLCKVRDLFRRLDRQEEELGQISDKLSQQQKSLKQHNAFLDVLASRDGLTGLYNRRHLNKVLIKEFEQYAEREEDLCLLLFDIDYFDELNKSMGRSYGDYVLNDFAARLTHATQPDGLCFRFSGETFVALLPDTDLSQAIGISEKVRSSLAEKPFRRGNEERTLTISVGAASLIEHHPDDPDDFITMVERALFLAKSEGRNRVSVYQSIDKAGTSSQQNLVLLKTTLTKILDKTRKSAIDSLQLLARDMAGKNNQYHIERVRQYVELLGTSLNLTEPVIETLKNAITLHTSIRLLLHSELIKKQRAFSKDDREVMNDFPYKLAELTDLFDFFSNERAILLYHGERYDGSGHPEGLRGDEIPLGARLFSLVDALVAMNSERPHRKRLNPLEIIEELTKEAGSQFDPDLVRKVLAIIKMEKLLDVDPMAIDASIRIITDKFPHDRP